MLVELPARQYSICDALDMVYRQKIKQH